MADPAAQPAFPLVLGVEAAGTVTAVGGSFLISTAAAWCPWLSWSQRARRARRVLETYPFDETPAALRAVESGPTLGKVVIDLARSTRT